MRGGRSVPSRILCLLWPGSDPSADGGVHIFSGAGEDAAAAAERSAQALHPGGHQGGLDWGGWFFSPWPLHSPPSIWASWQEFSGSSPKRRRAEDKDEGIGSPDIWEDEKAEDLRREMIELRQQLDKERSVRMMLEEQVCPAGLAAGSQGIFWAVHQQTNAPQGRQGTRARANSQRPLLHTKPPRPLWKVTSLSLAG